MKQSRLIRLFFVVICSTCLALSTAEATIVSGGGRIGYSYSGVTCKFSGGVNGVTLTISANPLVNAVNIRSGYGNDLQYVKYSFAVLYNGQLVRVTPYSAWILVNDNTPLMWAAPLSANFSVNTLVNPLDGQGYSVMLYTQWIDGWTHQFIGDLWELIDRPGSYQNLRLGFNVSYSNKSCIYPRGFRE